MTKKDDVSESVGSSSISVQNVYYDITLGTGETILKYYAGGNRSLALVDGLFGGRVKRIRESRKVLREIAVNAARAEVGRRRLTGVPFDGVIYVTRFDQRARTANGYRTVFVEWRLGPRKSWLRRELEFEWNYILVAWFSKK